MGFLDKAKTVAGQVATKTKEGVEDIQAKLDLGNAYNELGKATFELIESGELADERLDEHAAKVRALHERLEKDEADAAEDTEAAPEPEPSVATEQARE